MNLLGMGKGHMEKKILFLLPKAVKKKAPVALALGGGGNNVTK